MFRMTKVKMKKKIDPSEIVSVLPAQTTSTPIDVYTRHSLRCIPLVISWMLKFPQDCDLVKLPQAFQRSSTISIAR